MTVKGVIPGTTELDHTLLRLARECAANGRPLPGEFELVDRLGCTRQQLRRALSELERLGIVHRRQGAATMVDPVGLRMSVRLEDQFEHSELISRLGYEPSVDILESSEVPLPPRIAALLGVETGRPSVRQRKRWRADGRPVMLADGYLLVPGPVVRPLDDSVFVAVSEVWGESLVWDVATPGVALLDPEHANDLELKPGDPVMTLELVGVAASGRRLFYATELHHPDFIQYSFVRTVRPPWNSA